MTDEPIELGAGPVAPDAPRDEGDEWRCGMDAAAVPCSPAEPHRRGCGWISAAAAAIAVDDTVQVDATVKGLLPVTVTTYSWESGSLEVTHDEQPGARLDVHGVEVLVHLAALAAGSPSAPPADGWEDLRAAIDGLPVDDPEWRAWVVEDDDPDWNVVTSDGCDVARQIPDDDEPRVARYIAAADPTTIAALLAERDALAAAAGSPSPTPPDDGAAISRAKRDDLAALAEDWDGYGAAPLTAEVLSILDVLAVVPINTGGLQIEWHTLGWDVEVEIAPDGSPAGFWMGATTAAPAAPPAVVSPPSAPSGLARVAEAMATGGLSEVDRLAERHAASPPSEAPQRDGFKAGDPSCVRCHGLSHTTIPPCRGCGGTAGRTHP